MDADTLPYLVEWYPLLITKLYIPRLDSKLLTRTHLLELLDHAANRSLVLITAPAGWGKTTLVANWARRSERETGWISLDEGDNDLARFWLHLIAALQQIHKGVGETALSWFYMPAASRIRNAKSNS